MVYRRFGYLQSRLLLEKQEHLRQLENELDNLDLEDAETWPRQLTTMENYDNEQHKPRRHLMRRIDRAFRRYGTACTMRMLYHRIDAVEQHPFFRLLSRSHIAIARLLASIKAWRTL